MKRTTQAATCRTAVVLMALGAAITAGAATTPLQGHLTLRPLSPSDKTDYGLSTAQGASGMQSVGVGQPAYLEAQVNIAIPATNITGVSWSLTSKPLGSTAALSTSPLGANVPIYEPVDRTLHQVAGRMMLRPDVRGDYVVTATINAGAYGTTNVTQTITAGNYMGLSTCALCHSGGLIAENMMATFTNTLHASKFTRSIDGLVGSYSKNCISCHTLGYDVNTNAVNGGFDDVATQLGWTFPTVLTNGNWAAMPSQLKNLANIQCESCHGPGSEHAYSLGDTNKIAVSWDSGNCGQCHDAKTHHNKNPEWANSKHAVATSEPSGAGREGCVGCHTGKGFAGRMSGSSVTNTTYSAIGCAACHDPHDAKNPHQLRHAGAVTLNDGTTTITNGGNGALCMKCHMSRVNAKTYVETTAGSSRFGPHHGPQADMLAGANGVTYNKAIPSSAHRDVVKDSCAHCHMQEVEYGNPAWLHAGGHTFSMKYDAGTNSIEMTEACKECHGEVEGFNFARQDFDGDGIVSGVQDEVKGLLNRLALLLPPVGTPKSALAIGSSWTKPQLRAAFNYQFVLEDGSFGVHNLAYAVGLLKASIADLTGDANQDGLPDTWQQQYFGANWASDPKAAASASPAGDGMPNWLKYALGLDPNVKGQPITGGVVYANGNRLGGSTNTIQIYTAAEVTFNTEVGKNYQIQAVSSLGAGWQNVGGPIAGTGNAVSYVTPTRQNVKQYYRVYSY